MILQRIQSVHAVVTSEADADPHRTPHSLLRSTEHGGVRMRRSGVGLTGIAWRGLAVLRSRATALLVISQAPLVMEWKARQLGLGAQMIGTYKARTRRADFLVHVVVRG